MKSTMYFLQALVLVLALMPALAKTELCQVAEQDLLARERFISNLQVANRNDLADISKTERDTRSTLRAMNGAHLASKISMTVSAVAGLVAGGAAISSLYFSGQSVSFLGMAVHPGTIGAHLYSTYSIGSNVVTLGQVGWDIWNDERTPQEYLQDQMDQLGRQSIFSADAILFITAPRWGGWSDKLQSPLIQQSFLKLDQFYRENIRVINDNGGVWSYVGEFWHKKGQKRAALDYAVASEAVKLQKLRIAYFDLLIKTLSQHRRYCYFAVND
ncbi:MAG: hypothetical protein A2X86_14555 [Bdellovibrionales bacterium GWA2_49_15]|nr:MAG: hypothetical protein A2X86_14555 [Bdellovibrionales bacterium GWA2_49_15]HAZ13439.1 hypothetical protein [Bdellovibrionales bacterium]